ncbi:MAG: Gfo/Idh/MocA family oxidoreductase [Faecalibacterium sp.]
MTPIRFGILGLGGIAPKFVDAINQCDGATLYAVAARDDAKAAAFATQYGAQVSYGSYEALVQDENVDIVYISVIHTYHVALAKLAITHGKAVICEKPLSVDLAALEELIALAKEKNVLLMEALWSRFLPQYNKAKQWIAEGKIGDARLFTASFSYNSPYDPTRQVFDPARSGGAVFGVGCYTISAALDFCGGQLPTHITGAAHMTPSGVDSIGAASLVFENGMLANFTFGSEARTEHCAYIYGGCGKIKLEKFYDCHKVMLYNDKEELIETCSDEVENGFIYETQHFCDLYRASKKESDVMSLQNSLDCMQVIETLRLKYLAQ